MQVRLLGIGLALSLGSQAHKISPRCRARTRPDGMPVAAAVVAAVPPNPDLSGVVTTRSRCQRPLSPLRETWAIRAHRNASGLQEAYLPNLIAGPATIDRDHRLPMFAGGYRIAGGE